jgi:hypothetical protein
MAADVGIQPYVGIHTAAQLNQVAFGRDSALVPNTSPLTPRTSTGSNFPPLQ